MMLKSQLFPRSLADSFNYLLKNSYQLSVVSCQLRGGLVGQDLSLTDNSHCDRGKLKTIRLMTVNC